ncbi:HNH endonuclease [Nocardia africana]
MRQAQRRARDSDPQRAEVRRATAKEWRDRNPDYFSNWRIQNPSRLEYERNYYRDHADRYLENSRRQRRENPESTRISKHKYRSQVRSTHIPRTPEQWQAKFDYWGRRCWICKVDLDGVPYQIDHVKPINKGGMDCLSNLRPACGTCNRSKSDRWPFSPAA